MVRWLMVGLRESHKHLPKQVLPPFDGNVKGWLGFWGLFEKVHDNDTIQAEVKFQHINRPQLLRGACISSCKRLKIAVNGFNVDNKSDGAHFDIPFSCL